MISAQTQVKTAPLTIEATPSQAVCLLSGGLDSTTLAYLLKSQGYELHCVSAFYGQKHAKELDVAERIARSLGAHWYEVDLSSVGRLLNSALTDVSIAVPDGHYAAEVMKATVVPNRNAILLSVAYGLAASVGATTVGIATHGGDHFIYPDCRPAFLTEFSKMEEYSFGDQFLHAVLYAPFRIWSKADIVRLGKELGVPYELTWSCYKGEAKHCGTCGTCVERKEAFQLAGMTDPTEYQV